VNKARRWDAYERGGDCCFFKRPVRSAHEARAERNAARKAKLAAFDKGAQPSAATADGQLSETTPLAHPLPPAARCDRRRLHHSGPVDEQHHSPLVLLLKMLEGSS